MASNMYGDFEFERRFFCQEFPARLDDGFPPNLIIQNYYLAQDGYAIRIRLQASSIKVQMTPNTSWQEILENYQDAFDLAIMTVKGPTTGGTRYETETTLDADVAKELIKRGGQTIVKNRYSSWIGADGWVIDVFGAENSGLVIAECERMSPVVDLEIPDFCIAEITDDTRFSNDQLVNKPYSAFRAQFENELETLPDSGPKARFSNQFGVNSFSVV